MSVHVCVAVLACVLTSAFTSPQVPDVPLAPLIAGTNSALTARLAALPFEQLLSLASSLHAAQQVSIASCSPHVCACRRSVAPAWDQSCRACVLGAQEGIGVGRTLEGVQAVLDPRSILSLCSTPLLAMPAPSRGYGA